MLRLDVLEFYVLPFILRLGLFLVCSKFLAILSLDVLTKKAFLTILCPEIFEEKYHHRAGLTSRGDAGKNCNSEFLVEYIVGKLNLVKYSSNLVNFSQSYNLKS